MFDQEIDGAVSQTDVEMVNINCEFSVCKCRRSEVISIEFVQGKVAPWIYSHWNRVTRLSRKDSKSISHVLLPNAVVGMVLNPGKFTKLDHGEHKDGICLGILQGARHCENGISCQEDRDVVRCMLLVK